MVDETVEGLGNFDICVCLLLRMLTDVPYQLSLIFYSDITPEASASCRNLYWRRKSRSTILKPIPKINTSSNNKKISRLSTAWRHIFRWKKNRTCVKSSLQSFSIAKVLFLWSRCLEGRLAVLTDILEHYQFCIFVFFELFQEEICHKWWSSMKIPSHTCVGTCETVKKNQWWVLRRLYTHRQNRSRVRLQRQMQCK